MLATTVPRPVARPWPLVLEPWDGPGPVEAARALRGRPHLAWLDSSLAAGGGADEAPSGRWSVLASDPRWTLAAYGAEVLYDGPCGTRRLPPGAIRAFAQAVEAESPPEGAALDAARSLGVPFVGGAIGYLGYELAREVERLPSTTVDDVGAPTLAMAWYDAALAWDHLEGRGWLVGRTDAVARLRARLGVRLDRLPVMAASGAVTASPDAGPRGDTLSSDTLSSDTPSGNILRSNMTGEAYFDAVRRVLGYIRAGDVYQVNFSQRFSVPVPEDGFDLHLRLRETSAAPFAAYLDARGAFGGVEVISSSPERFLLVDGDLVETRPIKGTRPRGRTPGEDAGFAAELRASTKDLAEHVMIVDLERNDLGRVSRAGSVHVPAFAELESFRQVHHLTSTVRGRLREDATLEELLRATFPGGSITGAPKVRALEIIDELEPTVRGVYTGAVGYVSAHGQLDLNIAIRTITLADGVAHFHAGGGIVHDSDPQQEYLETLHKARGMARALGVALPDEAGVVPGP